VELFGAGGGSDTIVVTTTELIVEAPVTPGGSCAGAEEDGCPGPTTPPVALEEGESDPETTLAGGPGEEVPPLMAGVPEVPPLMGGVPESPPAPVVPGDEQLGLAAPTAPEAPALAADPRGPEHDAPEVPDEVTVGPLPEGAVLVGDGVVAGEDGGVVAGDDAAVLAPDAVPAEQAVDPVAAPAVVETLAVI
jgi:hypothetical protein